MTPTEIRRSFARLNVWSRGGERAPHKALLVLHALGCLQRREPRLLSYREIDQKLRALLAEFGPPRRTLHPEYPFWRLKNDGIWEIADADRFKLGEPSGDARKTDLLRHDARGGLREDVFRALARNPRLLTSVAQDLLDANFPRSIQGEILDAVGLDLDGSPRGRSPRDASFRNRVLLAYEYRCAVCRASLRLCDRTIAIEAAHIKWHQAGGPDIERNGLALCVLHHRVFDLGAFMIDTGRRVRVSESAHGGRGFDDWLGTYCGRPIARPVRKEQSPDETFLQWHRSQVFHGPPRERSGSLLPGR